MIKNDKYDGYGKFVHCSGKIEEGVWDMNKFVGPASDPSVNLLTPFDQHEEAASRKMKKTIAFASETSSHANGESQKVLQTVDSSNKIQIRKILHQERP